MTYTEREFDQTARPKPVVPKAAIFKQLGYHEHSEGQWEFHNTTARFRTLCCGRRWGKSLAAGMEMTAALFVPNSFYWIVGPTYKLGEKEFRVVKNNLKKLRFGGTSMWTHPDVRKRDDLATGQMWVEMPWGTKLEVVSAKHPDSLQGEGLAGVCMSEAATHTLNTWDQYVEPTLSDTKGWAILPSTPKGLNWFKGFYDLGQDPNQPLYASWRFATWMNRAKYDGTPNDPEIQRIRWRPDETGQPMSQALFDQEYGAMFTSKAGRIFTNFHAEKNVREFELDMTWRFLWCIDFGFTNPFVRIEAGVDEGGTWWIFGEYYRAGINTDRHAKILKAELAGKPYELGDIHADPRQPDQCDIFAENGLFCITEVVPEWQGQEYIQRLLGEGDVPPKMFVHPRCVNLIREFENLEGLEPTSEKRNAREGAIQKSNHCTDALRYAVGNFYFMGSGEDVDEYVGDRHTSGEDVETYFQNIQHTTTEGMVF